MTLSAWVKPLTAGPGGIVDKNRTSGYALYINNSIFSFEIIANRLDFVTKPKFGVWQFITGTYDGTTSKVYINGVLDASTTFTATMTNTVNNLLIGMTNDNLGFTGLIAEGRVWNRPLTATEIAALYYQGTVPSSGLVVEQKLDEGAGTTTLNSIGNTGTITGATYTSDVPMVSRLIVGGNLIWNGNFEYAPPFTAVTTSGGGFITGQAVTGSSDIFRITANPNGSWGASWDTSLPRSGVYSFKVSTTGISSYCVCGQAPSGAAASVKKYGIPIQPNTPYTFTGWMKTNYVSGLGTQGARIKYDTWDGTGAFIVGQNPAYVQTTTGWTQYTLTFTSAANAAFLTLYFGVEGAGGTGTLIMDAWFDDFVLTPTTNTVRLVA